MKVVKLAADKPQYRMKGDENLVYKDEAGKKESPVKKTEPASEQPLRAQAGEGASVT